MGKAAPTEWTVLAPGPSLAQVTKLEAQGPIVAINRAVLSDLPWDIFAAQDGPKNLQEVLERIRGRLTWCSDRHAPIWLKHGARVWHHPGDRGTFKSTFPRCAPIGVNWMSRTILVVLGRIYGLGATRIKVYGCDMLGSGYSHGTDEMGRKEDKWDQRWVREKELVEKALAGIRKECEVELV